MFSPKEKQSEEAAARRAQTKARRLAEVKQREEAAARVFAAQMQREEAQARERVEAENAALRAELEKLRNATR